ncbi:hypothetical protein BXZ70DRAFT_994729 [Cristinia sonorae]|uniref:Uncharacterized protein n=1 Tax=Cristinia sonorae TaxID=1940300 RepID=A0A8K0UFZ3_9AGAR|nr:hypothetical protein BXZ70DRAFT_994729 [Cristinia sonorae]
MKEGLPIWDASLNRSYLADLFFALGGADSPGMAFINGLVGHLGRYGCRLYCGLPGRRKDGASQYFPAMTKPQGNYNVDGCMHDDLQVNGQPENRHPIPDLYTMNLRKLQGARNMKDYQALRLNTGIVKPTIFSGLPKLRMFKVPTCFCSDLMHLITFNLGELNNTLWRGTLYADKTDPKSTWDWAVLSNPTTWKEHGQMVRDATPYLPGSFDRPPRNPAEKITSGYKAWEYLLYIYGIAPAVIRGVLPQEHYQNFCSLVYAIRILQQRRITAEQLQDAHQHLTQYVEDFERLYYQRRADRLHMVRQSVHLLTHLAPETVRVGPLALTSQWTMETVIGNLGSEIRQPSHPFENLCERATIRTEVNALKAMIPGLEPDMNIFPRGSVDLRDGYVLLAAHDKWFRDIPAAHQRAIKMYLASQGDYWDICLPIQVKKWARLRLPNSQIARSAWKECQKPLESVRMSRNVKLVSHNDHLRLAEVLYYFQMRVNGKPDTFATVVLYSTPDPIILNESRKTVWACRKGEDAEIIVIQAKTISAVVAMPPLPLSPAEKAEINSHMKYKDRYYLIEKPGLDVAWLAGILEGGELSGSSTLEEDT